MDTQTFGVDDFATESGAVLSRATIEYTVEGRLNATRDNVVLVPSCYMDVVDGVDWLVGEGCALDPAQYCIVRTELFGNGRSSSPSNTAAPFDGPRLPVLTIRDNVDIVHRLLTTELEVTGLRAVVGFSMGAMQAFQWAVSHPGFVRRIVAICGMAKSYAHGNVRLDGQIAALTTDSAFAGGDYTAPPEAGLSAFGMVWAAWLYSQRWWRDELWRSVEPDRSFDDVVDEFRTSFLPGADANDVILQCRTWQQHDVGTTPGVASTAAALAAVDAEVLYLPCTTDLYFPVDDARLEAALLPNVTLAPIRSLWGHPAGGGADPAAADFITGAIQHFLADRPVTNAQLVRRNGHEVEHSGSEG